MVHTLWMDPKAFIEKQFLQIIWHSRWMMIVSHFEFEAFHAFLGSLRGGKHRFTPMKEYKIHFSDIMLTHTIQTIESDAKFGGVSVR